MTVKSLRCATLRNAVLCLVAASLMPVTSGCALAFSGPKQSVFITSAPEGARVEVNGKYLGQTPLTVELERARSQNIKFTRNGFADEQLHVHQQNSAGWFVFDIGTCVIPLTLCIPVLIDAISGSWFHFDDELRVQLKPALSPGKKAPSSGQLDL